MVYDLVKLTISTLLRLISDVASALTRLDERIARSPVGEGFVERSHFADAYVSLWIDGEVVNLEDLVLHDATKDIRTPTHELTIARDVLRTRPRLVAQPPDWALSTEGLRSLRQARAWSGQALPAASLDDDTSVVVDDDALPDITNGAVEGNEEEDACALSKEFASIDALIARSEAALEQARALGPAKSAPEKIR